MDSLPVSFVVKQAHSSLESADKFRPTLLINSIAFLGRLSLLSLFFCTSFFLPLKLEALQDNRVCFQAHRGGMNEVPENTLAALRHCWNIEGAIPEVDVRTTLDGIFVCIHDDTLGRTTNAPSKEIKVSEVTFSELRTFDAGSFFSSAYSGQRIPSLKEIFFIMRGNPQRKIYLDIKDADLDSLALLVEQHALQNQVIFTSQNIEDCEKLSKLYTNCQVMLSLVGNSEEIKDAFHILKNNNFQGFSHLQVSFSPEPDVSSLNLNESFLQLLLQETKPLSIELQVKTPPLKQEQLKKLLELGIRYYVSDSPHEFLELLRESS